MKLTIFAASGGIGRLAVHQAVAAGHEVTAAVRDPAKVASDKVRTVAVDLSRPDQDALREALAGADAVLSGLGAATKADFGVAERGTRAICEAMRATGVRRIVVISAAPIGTVPSPGRPNPPRHDPGDAFMQRSVAYPIVKAILKKRYADLARMEDVLRASTLDWTALRPPRLNDKALTGRYRTEVGRNVRGGGIISRADVAHCMLEVLDDPSTFRQTVGLSD
ncbi:NAD(P)H-binding protein [Streptomyces sp. ASQP_92]|uniref:NAD(P)-dependent oxidoreductase n=1 Tax=Streptomyces sp. ASQP_92 TaxID=2979116 RepID=UPI0021BF9557|nr:NAD(P)H-binding protein [Streptomyces sp. ASQP_92]MCT9087508.1 NAD(P)H-binding protein [Streptomyces sp. ASQP_92]